MKANVYVDGAKLGALFTRATPKYKDAARAAVRKAVNQVAQQIQDEGRKDIASAGKFGARWIFGFEAKVSEGGGSIKVDVTEEVPYWTVFEYGATIHGKPLLWIPLSFADVPEGTWARDYPGQLFRVNRGSGGTPRWRGTSSMGPRSEPMHPTSSGTDVAPLLLDAQTKQPKYFGKTDVTIPQKFHLRPIAREASKQLPLLWRAEMKKAYRHGG